MLSRISVSFNKTAEVPKMPQDAYEALKELFPGHYRLKEGIPDWFYNEEIFGDVNIIAEALLPFKCFEIKILEIGNGTMKVKMTDRIEKLVGEGVLEEVHQYMKGGIVQISIPDIGLLLMDEVTWLEDCCTEELQKSLNDGWRIIAVCPPNSQRRPDYILGRRRRS